jgi:3-methyladenine DNA glycosylase AlkD
MLFEEIRLELRRLANPEKARVFQGFFKTGTGQYGEGDLFIGVTVPQCREIARKYAKLSFVDIRFLLESKIHEERLTGLLILVEKYENAASRARKKEVIDFYIRNLQKVNNWDLVDLTAPRILGEWLVEKKDGSMLESLAVSDSLWKRRISIVSTFAFIRRGIYGDTLRIAELLLQDKEDLIHKSVGWMLREVGKRNEGILERFLEKNVEKMSRTTLRYAIECMPEAKKKAWLKNSKRTR